MASVGAASLYVALCGVTAFAAASPEDPFLATYQESVARMSQADESFASVALNPAPGPMKPVPVASKTCSQRCSTRCSVSCTTTRGCSSSCKAQTEGCGGSSTGESSSPTTTGTKKTDAEIIDINSASYAEILNLPGVGPATTQKIIDGRPYRAKNELVTRRILSQSTYDSIKAWIIAKQQE
jgi:DNA uptake protein ComE-like DNA-binding protein